MVPGLGIPGQTQPNYDQTPRLVAALAFSGQETVVEIGAGLGDLTVFLSQSARRLVALELDHRLAVIADTPQPVAPCGLCRQVLMEFAPHCQVIMANLNGDYQVLTLDQLLPSAFNFQPPSKPR